jgi:hypothetical protein
MPKVALITAPIGPYNTDTGKITPNPNVTPPFRGVKIIRDSAIIVNTTKIKKSKSGEKEYLLITYILKAKAVLANIKRNFLVSLSIAEPI